MIVKSVSSHSIEDEIELLKVSDTGKKIMMPKSEIKIFKIINIPVKLAFILKQELLARGGDFALPENIFNFNYNDNVNGILIGSKSMYRRIIEKLSSQSFKLLRNLADELNNLIFNLPNNFWLCRNKKLLLDKTLVMGILNVTPDSFFDGGRYFNLENAKKRIETMVKEKADIIDVGGESTRPGAEKISIAEEIKRVVPAIEWIKNNFDIPISIDTYKSDVAEAALDAGADIVNDISGLTFEKNIAKAVAKRNAGLVIMHIKGTPSNMQNNPEYENVIEDIYNYFIKQTNFALSNNILREQIAIDPGIGFGKNLEHNLQIIKRLDEFLDFKYPIMIGASNKTLINKLLGLDMAERLTPTAAINVFAVLKGAKIIRVHSVKENYDAVRMIEGILNVN